MELRGRLLLLKTLNVGANAPSHVSLPAEKRAKLLVRFVCRLLPAIQVFGWRCAGALALRLSLRDFAGELHGQ